MMQRIIHATKHIFIFLGLLAVTVWFVVGIGSASYKHLNIVSYLQSVGISETEFQTLIHNNAVVSFILAYILGKQFTKEKQVRPWIKFGAYVGLYSVLFIVLTILVLYAL